MSLANSARSWLQQVRDLMESAAASEDRGFCRLQAMPPEEPGGGTDVLGWCRGQGLLFGNHNKAVWRQMLNKEKQMLC